MFASILLAPMALLLSSQDTPAAASTGNDRAAIEKTLLAYQDALNASDVELAVGLYTADGVFMPVGAPTAQGTEALQAAYGAVFQAIQLNVVFTIDEIQVHGNVAFARTRSAGTTLIRATNNTVAEANRELFVLERQDGNWRIAQYTFNKEPE